MMGDFNRAGTRFGISLILFLLLFGMSAVGQEPAPRPKLPSDLETHIKKDILETDKEWDVFEFGVRFRWGSFDLNADSKQEYFVVSECSPTGNCRLNVVQRYRKGFRNLLSAELVQVVCVRPTERAGYKDIETRSHGGALESDASVFRFTGSTYELSEGYRLRWEYDDKTGKSRQVEGPRKSTCRQVTLRYIDMPRRPD